MQASVHPSIRLLPSWLIATLVALKLTFLFAFAWQSQIVMDEFGQLGFAKYIGAGVFDTVEPTKALGATLLFKVAHLIGDSASSIMLTGRLMTALLACGTLGLIYACAHALGQNRATALLVVLLLLSFSNFIEQIFRTRAEPLAVFFAASALLVLLRGRPDRVRTLLAVGVLSGLSFLATQKAVYFNVAMGMALLGDAAAARNYIGGLKRGAWLVSGWLAAIAGYCLALGGLDPLPVAANLIIGPMEVATRGGSEYGGLRGFVMQTLVRNFLPYALCLGGLLLALGKFREAEWRKRIALIFTFLVTIFVFLHDQPWPYVFVMPLPFIALWGPLLFDRIPGGERTAGIFLLAIVALSLVRNLDYLEKDNDAELSVVDRAEVMLGPEEVYFDGIGMLPNRHEPSTLWLDQHYILETRAKGPQSEAYRIIEQGVPKLILWSYRMDAIAPIIAPALDSNYVRVAPNIWMIGYRLNSGSARSLTIPAKRRFALYSLSGEQLVSPLLVDGVPVRAPLELQPGNIRVALPPHSGEAFLLPVGDYEGLFQPDAEDLKMFVGTYD